jgi:hypothetical protein
MLTKNQLTIGQIVDLNALIARALHVLTRIVRGRTWRLDLAVCSSVGHISARRTQTVATVRAVVDACTAILTSHRRTWFSIDQVSFKQSFN